MFLGADLPAPLALNRVPRTRDACWSIPSATRCRPA